MILGEQTKIHPEWEPTMGVAAENKDKLKRKDLEISLADLMIVPSDFVKHTLDYYPSVLPPIEIVQYGAPATDVTTLTDKGQNKKLQLLYCGSLSQRKGLADVFTVVEQIKDIAELTVIGGGAIDKCTPLREGLAKVKYIPSVSQDELLQIMQKKDIFFFPSHFEGFALVVFDAMSQGLPLLTTKVTSGPIVDGFDGWIVKPGDIDSMVAIVRNLNDNRSEITACSRNAIQTAAKNSWAEYQNSLVEKIKSI